MKKFVVLSAMLAVLLMAASAQAAYYDALNVNFGDGNGAPNDVSGTIYTPQSPTAFGSNWNNAITQSNAWYTTVLPDGNGGGWAGLPAIIKTANGTDVAVGDSSKFYINFYGQDYMSGEWAGIAQTQGGTGLSAWGWTGKGGIGGTWVYGTNVPFTTFDVYGLTGALTDGIGGQVAGTWFMIGSYTGNFAFKMAGDHNWGSLAAMQFLSTNPLDGPTAAVPEPAGLGLIGLALLAVRKRRS